MFINHGTFYPYYVFITTEQQAKLLRYKRNSIYQENSWIKWWILQTLRCSTYFIIPKTVYYE